MLAIIDYGVGNLLSIKNMLKRIGYTDVEIADNPEVIDRAERLILPGVGHFDYGMTNLKSRNLIDCLNKRVLEENIPILGICLGAQLITNGSEEGVEPGLGWINANVVKFDSAVIHESGLKIPHMGWAETEPTLHHKINDGFLSVPRFYFVHSYHIQCTSSSNVLMTSQHGQPFVAAVHSKNIIGVQFHPEKSHKYGMKLLENFLAFNYEEN